MLSLAAMRAWLLPRVTMFFQYLYRDEQKLEPIPERPRVRDNRWKPSLQAFRLPFAQMGREGAKATVWGQVRGGRHGRKAYRLEVLQKNTWKPIKPTRLTNADGFFMRTIRLKPSRCSGLVAHATPIQPAGADQVARIPRTDRRTRVRRFIGCMRQVTSRSCPETSGERRTRFRGVDRVRILFRVLAALWRQARTGMARAAEAVSVDRRTLARKGVPASAAPYSRDPMNLVAVASHAIVPSWNPPERRLVAVLVQDRRRLIAVGDRAIELVPLPGQSPGLELRWPPTAEQQGRRDSNLQPRSGDDTDAVTTADSGVFEPFQVTPDHVRFYQSATVGNGRLAVRTSTTLSTNAQ